MKVLKFTDNFFQIEDRTRWWTAYHHGKECWSIMNERAHPVDSTGRLGGKLLKAIARYRLTTEEASE